MYQMDPGNSDEALREVALDIAEGTRHGDGQTRHAVPGHRAPRQTTNSAVPTFAYQVSGEYAMIKAAAPTAGLTTTPRDGKPAGLQRGRRWRADLLSPATLPVCVQTRLREAGRAGNRPFHPSNRSGRTAAAHLPSTHGVAELSSLRAARQRLLWLACAHHAAFQEQLPTLQTPCSSSPTCSW